MRADNELTIDGIKLEEYQVNEYNKLCPVKCTYFGYNNNLSLNIAINTPDINRKKFKRTITNLQILEFLV